MRGGRNEPLGFVSDKRFIKLVKFLFFGGLHE